jgi:hypothetical protein
MGTVSGGIITANRSAIVADITKFRSEIASDPLSTTQSKERVTFAERANTTSDNGIAIIAVAARYALIRFGVTPFMLKKFPQVPNGNTHHVFVSLPLYSNSKEEDRYHRRYGDVEVNGEALVCSSQRSTIAAPDAAWNETLRIREHPEHPGSSRAQMLTIGGAPHSS